MVGLVGSGGWLEAHGSIPGGLRISKGDARAKPSEGRRIPSYFLPRVLAVTAISGSRVIRDLR